MLFNQISTALILVMLAGPAIAQRSLAEELAASPHYKLVPSTPQLAAIEEWHSIVVNNNYQAYRELTLGGPHLLSLSSTATEEMRKSIFSEIKSSTPTYIKVSEPFRMPSGNYLVHASGCKKGLVHTVMLSLFFDDKRWRVLDGIWHPDRNKTICGE